MIWWYDDTVMLTIMTWPAVLLSTLAVFDPWPLLKVAHHQPKRWVPRANLLGIARPGSTVEDPLIHKPQEYLIPTLVADSSTSSVDSFLIKSLKFRVSVCFLINLLNSSKFCCLSSRLSLFNLSHFRSECVRRCLPWAPHAGWGPSQQRRSAALPWPWKVGIPTVYPNRYK